MSSLSAFFATDGSGIAVQHIPSYKTLFFPQKFEALVRQWISAPESFQLLDLNQPHDVSDEEFSEFIELLTENNLID